MIPIRLGEEWDFTTARLLLIESGFTELEIARRFGIADLGDFESNQDAEQVEPFNDSALGLLIRLFIEGRYVGERIARDRLGSPAIQAMERLGLVGFDSVEPDNIQATVSLYPTADVYLVSDRWNTPGRTPFVVSPDIVYSAIVSNSRRFLAFMPTNPCNDFLDLGAGTGVAALTAAKHFAARSYAFDLAERSGVFAEFNRRLNALPNVVIRCGDLYGPSAGATYDRIVTHPPYVPVLRPKYVYHDGGEDGESIVRRVIEGLPSHLRAGGLFYMLAMGSDRAEAPFEQRLRGWLGAQEADFDILFAPKQLSSPEDWALKSSIRSQTPLEDFNEFKDRFAKLQVSHLVYGFVLIQRRDGARRTFTARRHLGPRTSPAELSWALQWETMLTGPDPAASILAARPHRNPETVWHSSQKLADDGWSTGQHTLRTDYPFSMEANTDAWSPFLVGICDGSKTVREHFDALKSEGVLPPTGDPVEFARAVAALVSGGFIFLE